MTHEDACIERIKKLDRLYLAQKEASDILCRDRTEVNYRRWSFLFERYAEQRDALRMWSKLDVLTTDASASS